jgi:hypothetical protein
MSGRSSFVASDDHHQVFPAGGCVWRALDVVVKFAVVDAEVEHGIHPFWKMD